jgi:hypothetical protein
MVKGMRHHQFTASFWPQFVGISATGNHHQSMDWKRREPPAVPEEARTGFHHPIASTSTVSLTHEQDEKPDDDYQFNSNVPCGDVHTDKSGMPCQICMDI